MPESSYELEVFYDDEGEVCPWCFGDGYEVVCCDEYGPVLDYCGVCGGTGYFEERRIHPRIHDWVDKLRDDRRLT